MSFRKLIGGKAIYATTLVVLAILASGFYLLSDGTIVSAQKGDIASRGDSKGKVARADQLAFALRLGAASDYTVFGAKGVKRDGATVTGKSGTGSDEASLGENGSGLKARSDLNKSLAMIKQLPCQDMEATLTGGTFAPGVYCAPSAALVGQMVLDAGGDSTGTFVFRIEGAMKSAENFRMELAGEAKPGNVYFVADTASLGPWNSIIGTVIARGSVDVGAGTSVNGRAISKESDVVLANGANLALAEGYIQICKEATGGTPLGPTGPGVVYQFLGLTQQDRNSLIRFNSDAPGVAISEVFITGMSPPTTAQPVRFMKAIDRRPATGEIFGLGNDDILYRIDATTGVATAIGPIGTVTTNSPIGFDFNPEVDRIRLVTNFGRNARIDPNDGSTIVDPNLNGSTSAVSGAAYTNNFVGGPATTLYDISDQTDTLYIQNPPNSGTLAPVGPLGVDIVFINGFDIYGPDNVAFAALDPASGPTQSMLYSINLATGAATLMGSTPNQGLGGGLRLAGLTVIGPPITTPSTGLENRIFQFQINGGQIIEVPVGRCSAPIQVPEGNNTIQELLSGFFTNIDRNAPGGTWFNRFRLVGVSESGYLPGSGAPAGTGITSVVLPTRTVGVNVPHATSNLPVILTFTNIFSIPGVIEICKYSASTITTQTGTPGTPGVGGSVPVNDTFVEGFFDFTVDALPGRTFSIPVGFCTGPIQVDVAAEPGPVPQRSLVRVTERAEAGFTLESGNILPSDRFVSLVLDQGIVSSDACSTIGEGPVPPACIENNVRGGFMTGSVIEADNASNQTIFRFFNRTNPGILKVCKIAGPGVPVGTRFEFFIAGRQAQSQFAGGSAILPGTDITRTVTVNAGPPEQGGNCVIVSEPSGANTLFIVGTQAFVREFNVLDDVAGVENCAFGDTQCAFPVDSNDGPDTSPNSEVIVSRIRLNNSTAIPSPASISHAAITTTLNPNPNLRNREVIVPVNRGETVVEYTNILFRPTQLKVCKVAGTGIAVGTPFTFTIAVDNENGLVPVNAQNNTGPTFPAGSNPFTIPAGDPLLSAQGNCVIVDGPYGRPNPGQAPPLSFGTFRVGSIISVTETGPASSVVITSPTGTPTVDPVNRRAFLTMTTIGGFNELIFVNSSAAPVSTGFSLAGRVMTPDGGGLRNAQVILTRSDGTRMAVPTSSMGYYNFEGLANESYTVSVSSRRYRFTARNVDLSASLANVDFTGIE